MTRDTDIQLYGFETSNNIKVRIGLGVKGIPYRFHTIDPKERGPILELSGQFLTPVMQHGETVLFDSAAILRYLDANFPDTPRLFGSSLTEQWEIEDWEFFARTKLAGPMLEVVHTRVAGGEVDSAMTQRCAAAFGEAIETLVTRMQGRECLVGPSLTAADIAAAPVLYRVRSAELFAMPDSVESLAAWQERVMSFDGAHRLAD